VRSLDPHRVKLVEACQQGLAATGDPAFAAAAEAVTSLRLPMSGRQDRGSRYSPPQRRVDRHNAPLSPPLSQLRCTSVLVWPALYGGFAYRPGRT